MGNKNRMKADAHNNQTLPEVFIKIMQDEKEFLKNPYANEKTKHSGKLET